MRNNPWLWDWLFWALCFPCVPFSSLTTQVFFGFFSWTGAEMHTRKERRCVITQDIRTRGGSTHQRGNNKGGGGGGCDFNWRLAAFQTHGPFQPTRFQLLALSRRTPLVGSSTE